MSNLTSTIPGYYSLSTFQTLRDLWQEMTATMGGDAKLMSNGDLRMRTNTRSDLAQDRQRLDGLPQFWLLQSDRFQALLTGTVVNLANLQQMRIEISFDPQQIERFIAPILDYFASTVTLIATDRANDSHLQSHFTQLLLAALASERISERETQLQYQVAQANLLTYISSQIHQMVELPPLLQAAIEQTQAFLSTDRLAIYQFEPAWMEGQTEHSGVVVATHQSCRVAYEALASTDLSSTLDTSYYQDRVDDRQLWEEYHSSTTKSIDRVDLTYADRNYLLDLMQRWQVKSKLLVPIVVNSNCWGLLIAHQCQSVRNWQLREVRFLEQVAEQLSFAVHRSELHTASLWLTQSLEQRVTERTQELRDAVIVAQTANQSKTEFLALLSHELRTPLTSILGLSATLLRLPLLNLTDRQQKYLQIIHNSGEHLAELIDDILDFYKLEVGKTFLKVSEFSLSKLVEKTVDIVKAKAEQAKVEIEVTIINNGIDVSQVSGRDLRFRGDTKRIKQILLNLLVNAIKFTPEQGKIAIRTWLEDRYAVFEIEDSGIGIEEEQIPRLFKKFHQLNPHYDRDYAGMGLGLAIAQQLVELHGGWIDVDSVVGSGSTFTVRVASQPLQLPSESNDWEEMNRNLVFQDPELNPIPKRTILIEHDDNLADFICDVLTAARYQVTWLLSAESAFRQIIMLQPDLLIVDVTIDAATIDKLLENIRKSSTISNLEILAIASTEAALSPKIEQCVDDYLWKEINQINPEQLLRKITKLLNKKGKS